MHLLNLYAHQYVTGTQTKPVTKILPIPSQFPPTVASQFSQYILARQSTWYLFRGVLKPMLNLASEPFFYYQK